MCRFGLLLVILFLVRVQGGDINAALEIDILHFPYMAAILFREETAVFRYRCNGVIISNRHILTTATCIEGSLDSDIKVRVGSTYSSRRGRKHDVDSVQKHFKFSPNLDADIAVLKLSEPLEFSYRVGVVNLPKQDALINIPNTSNKEIITNVTFFTSYMVTRCSDSMELETTVGCNGLFKNKPPFKDMVTEDMLCVVYLTDTGDRQPFDSLGAPLVINGTVHGLYSWARRDNLSVKIFTRVSAFTEWIKTFKK